MSRIIDKELERGQKVIKLKLQMLCTMYGEADVADWAKTSVPMIQKFRNVNEDKYQMPAANLRSLSKQLSSLQDDTIIKDFTDSSQQVILSPPGSANGIVDDECKDLLKVAGEAVSCFEAGDKLGYESAMNELKRVHENMMEEGKSL